MSKQEKMLAVAKEMIGAEVKVLQNLSAQLNEHFVQAVELIMCCKGKILAIGAGTSGYVAGRFAHLGACCGLPVFFLHPCDALHGASGVIKENDVLIAISKGGETHEINELAKIGKARRASVVAITANKKSTLASLSDCVIAVKSEGADPYGVLACGSSLANAALTDAICAVVLSELGLDLKEFAQQHPLGAVGLKLKEQGYAA